MNIAAVVTAASTLALAAITYVYVRRAGEAVDEARRSSAAAESAAAAAQVAAEAAQRQAAAAERAELLDSMPLIWAKVGMAHTRGERRIRVRIDNAGTAAAALNVSLALFNGSAPVWTKDVPEPIPAAEGFDVGTFRVPGDTEISSITVRYQDRRGRDYLATSKSDGRWEYALMADREEGRGEVVDEWLIRSQRMPWDP